MNAVDIEPKVIVTLIDVLLSSLHEVEQITSKSPYDGARVAYLLAGARDAIEDVVKFDYPVRKTEKETGISRDAIHFQVTSTILRLATFKGSLLKPGSSETPYRTFMFVLVDINSLLSTPTLAEPLARYYQEQAAAETASAS